MSVPYKLLLLAGALGASFIGGSIVGSSRASKTQQTVQEQDSKKTHTQVTTTRTKSKTGETKTVTVRDTTAVVDTTKKTSAVIREDKQAPYKSNVSVLFAYDTIHRAIAPNVGLHVTTNLVGPINMGLWGVSTGIGGISFGWNY